MVTKVKGQSSNCDKAQIVTQLKVQQKSNGDNSNCIENQIVINPNYLDKIITVKKIKIGQNSKLRQLNC